MKLYETHLYETPPRLAKAVGVSVDTIRAAIHSGELEAIRFGSGLKATYRVSRDAWESYLKRRSTRRPVASSPSALPALKPAKRYF